MSDGEDKFKKLRRFNGFMAVLHFIQGSLMLYLANDFSIWVTSSYLKGMPGTKEIGREFLFEIPIGPVVALFLFISAFAHFSLSTFGYDWYKKNLKEHINKARWMEYSLSSSLMIVVIAMLVGYTDLGVLVVLFTVNASMIFFGWLMESYNQLTEKVRWSPFIFGWIAGVAPWIAIAVRLWTVAAKTAIPDFVLWIFVSIAIFFNVFALNQLLQYKGVWKWKDYLYGERMYIVLSLVAKSALGWQVFSGTLAG